VIRLEPRDTPTTFTPHFAADFPADLMPPVVSALHTASAHIDVPGVTDYAVSVEYDPRTLVLGYATHWPGEARGAIWLGAAVRSYDVESVTLHETAHALGVRPHSDDRGDVMYAGIAPGEVKRVYTAGDDVLLRGAGLVVPPYPLKGEGEGEGERPPTAPVMPEEVYPYTEDSPYRGPLVRVGLWGGWADVPPRVAADWGLEFTPEGR
jgi:hypothetical protein